MYAIDIPEIYKSSEPTLVWISGFFGQISTDLVQILFKSPDCRQERIKWNFRSCVDFLNI